MTVYVIITFLILTRRPFFNSMARELLSTTTKEHWSVVGHPSLLLKPKCTVQIYYYYYSLSLLYVACIADKRAPGALLWNVIYTPVSLYNSVDLHPSKSFCRYSGIFEETRPWTLSVTMPFSRAYPRTVRPGELCWYYHCSYYYCNWYAAYWPCHIVVV